MKIVARKVKDKAFFNIVEALESNGNTGSIQLPAS